MELNDNVKRKLNSMVASYHVEATLTSWPYHLLSPSRNSTNLNVPSNISQNPATYGVQRKRITLNLSNLAPVMSLKRKAIESDYR